MSYNPNNVNGQAAAASSAPVTLSNENVQDLNFTGQAAQTATVNNIIPAAVSANATDCNGYRSGLIQVISTGTGGTFIFEGSNDNTNFQTIPVWSQLVLTGTPVVAAITATSSNLGYTFPVNFRYIRLRIATTITGGSIQAFTRFTQMNWSPGIFQIAQATAANLNVTATGTITAVTTVTTLANGQTASSSPTTGNPVRIGGRVQTTLDTSLVDTDAANMVMTTGQHLMTKDFATSENDWTYAAASGGISNTTTAVTVKTAGGASIRNYVTGIDVMADALGAATEIAIRDGAAGTVLWRSKIGTSGLGLTSIIFPNPLRGTAATLCEIVTLTASITGAVYINVRGYQGF